MDLRQSERGRETDREKQRDVEKRERETFM